MATTTEPHLFIIFGATGDLMKRKLLPALYRVITENDVSDRIRLLGVARHPITEGEFRAMAQDALAAAGHTGDEIASFCTHRMFYEPVGDDDDLRRVEERIKAIEARSDGPHNRAFYLALPPRAVPNVVDRLGSTRLNESTGWTRVVFEKPFGRDLESARELNRKIHEHFAEDQVYRIDHYLGKETVQNLYTFRFANPIFESTWNRDRIQAVEITMAEDLGVGSRAGYYDKAGAVRDMMQSHMTQLLTLVAMDAPSSFNARSIKRVSRSG